MIISNISQLQKVALDLLTNKISATLPVEVLVLKKLSSQKYLLQIKDNSFETVTKQPLQVAQTYLASFSHDKKSNTIFLKHLYTPPLTKQEAIFTTEQLISHFKNQSKEKIIEFKSNIIHLLSNSSTKEEFTFLTQLLFGISQAVISLPFRYKDGFGLMQYKKRKKQEKQSQDEVEFYAYLKHLGPLEGIIGLKGDKIEIKIDVLFEESLKILQNHLNDFSLNSTLTIQLKEEIKPLFSLRENILDINI